MNAIYLCFCNAYYWNCPGWNTIFMRHTVAPLDSCAVGPFIAYRMPIVLGILFSQLCGIARSDEGNFQIQKKKFKNQKPKNWQPKTVNPYGESAWLTNWLTDWMNDFLSMSLHVCLFIFPFLVHVHAYGYVYVYVYVYAYVFLFVFVYVLPWLSG